MDRAAGFFRDRPFASFWGIAFATGVLLTLLVFFFYSSSRRQTEFVEKMVALRGAALISALEASVHAEMHLRWNREGFEVLLRELAKKEDVQYLAILDEAGAILAHSDPEQTGQHMPSLLDFVSEGGGGEARRTPWDGSVVVFGRRLKDAGGREVPTAGMETMHGGRPEKAWPEDMEKLTAVAAIRVAEFEKIRQQAFRQTSLILLVGGLLGVGAVFVSFVFQGYQLAHSNLRRLERARDVLNKFVPSAVVQLLEREPDAALEKTEQDVTVMFLDIAGYVSLSEAMAGEQLNCLIERCFARFLDLIRRHGGDVTETAGDGLMALFRSGSPRVHPQEAVRAALGIQRAAEALNAERDPAFPPIRVRIGVNSGACLVGSTKIRGASGERWTFTATGQVTNIAARLCAQAAGGEALLGPETADRLHERFRLESLGEHNFKNVTEPVRVFRLGQA
ncbi:MAG: hypothetical protein HYZ11_01630 [Candidatus Tectomicrobia bacterium]|uniref:Guanylate cyclase domain-containing protein n=1 Tax=Tectimicrobiota bacterium TaxID=2528274 RepID=A0A932HYQ4_UNCTE|nr:hypothetical protein [Candidatus Tectomicrobia bacterium]